MPLSEDELMKLIIDWMVSNSDCEPSFDDPEWLIFDDHAAFDARELAQFLISKGNK